MHALPRTLAPGVSPRRGRSRCAPLALQQARQEIGLSLSRLCLPCPRHSSVTAPCTVSAFIFTHAAIPYSCRSILVLVPRAYPKCVSRYRMGERVTALLSCGSIASLHVRVSQTYECVSPLQPCLCRIIPNRSPVSCCRALASLALRCPSRPRSHTYGLASTCW